ncbi:RNA polymerase-binding protein DksA [Buchnera aphidicola (Mindarus keteleerifoliae)]|uniref:RNA polymerase-binding protein DksA n=1 Tax=Buchnera aphidicola TaxID=9 RepID=UPI0031B6A068
MNKEKNKRSPLNILNFSKIKPYKKKNNEIYMNVDQINYFKKVLNTYRSSLKKEIKSTIYNICNENTNFPDPIDRASQEEVFNIALRNRHREHSLLKKIEKTIKKIISNDFGYCETCGIEIGIKRLEVHPTASLCIDCKTLSEIREKQMIG